MFFSLIALGLYHLGLFAVQRQEKGPLFLGFFCLCVSGLLSSSSGVLQIVIPNQDKVLSLKVFNFSIYLGLPALWLYMRSIFPHYYSSSLVKIIAAFSAVSQGKIHPCEKAFVRNLRPNHSITKGKDKTTKQLIFGIEPINFRCVR
ncbi:MAG TPA: 7TM diverse intracellular signaling domain-containing protein [Oligoflexus sp.]|uniref:7TM diverse intracellular signaling domain-containing protein n=1 Tax=Oligoflexus sp. TaxID=1971216 RepID=UPI002D4FFDC5|nr:7TM diverse intracellular signaling domain-containing protein [Oligoflexus sp.]HYX36575.1 7TM diverse intracellular signaling domain-containing protein [Oligoflexus sp.]